MQMKKILSFGLMLTLVLAACNQSGKDSPKGLSEKKSALEKLKKEQADRDAEIKKLEEDIAKLDPDAERSTKIKLVAVAPVTTRDFKHFIDLQGKVDAENISFITPRGMPGQVKAIYVKEGQRVRKGQLLLKLDDAIVRQQVQAATQQLEGIKTQLGFARNIYQRQQNLWDKGIGTEVQLITAKTNVEGLENQLTAAREQVKVAQEQLNTTNVYSDVDGIADQVHVKVGETFNGMNQIKIVNNSQLKVATNVPENYVARIHSGSPVEVYIPDVNKTLNTTISLISQSIDPTTRGFIAEARIPTDPVLKPNQSAVIKIMDYAAPNAVVIPVNVVQADESGKYVYVVETAGNKQVAKKKSIVIGEVYGEWVEVKSGLNAGEQLITEAYQNLYEGQLVGTGTK
jgi:RND family efflux transporter MFP subunit